MVYYDPTADFGPEGVRGTVKALNTSFGARADIGSWNVELSGGYGQQREGYDGVNIVHLLRLARAVAASDPAQAINPFGRAEERRVGKECVMTCVSRWVR